MIKPEELRIGNWVYDTSDPHQKIEKQWTFKDFEMSYASLDGNTSDFYRLGFEPIPLTPEWLERFGFILHNPGNFYARTRGENGVSILVYSHIYDLWCYQLRKGLDKPLKHVHQLQNLRAN